MRRYFFHFRDGRTPPDKEGKDLPDLEAARVEAVRQAAEALTRHAETFWNDGEWTLEVTDEAGLTLFTLYFLAVEAAAIRRQERQTS